ncbi:hypothetical protein RB2083_303 [Rhodobacteraceae bacterium HTCC2083]|nr:hypothetical protein RB2083_303 [Rhodobacteraceae bacterium HTCC2083]
MAYLDPKTLTCPHCGFSAKVNWVVGVGPHSKPGRTPSRRLYHIAPFTHDPSDRKVVICPECEAAVA